MECGRVTIDEMENGVYRVSLIKNGDEVFSDYTGSPSLARDMIDCLEGHQEEGTPLPIESFEERMLRINSEVLG